MPKILFEAVDPRRCLIYLTEEQFNDHILERHPEISDYSLIRKVIEKPDFIAKENKRPMTELYYAKGGDPKSPKLWLKVVVRRNMVITAFKLGRLKESEEVIWSPSQNS